MLKRRKQIAFIVFGVIALALAYTLGSRLEPEYEGHAFREWVLRTSPSDSTAALPFQPTQAEVRAAILAVGTNNLSLLVRWLSFDSSKSIFIPICHFMPL